jgi:integrase
MSLYKRGGMWWSRIVWHGEVLQRSTKCRNKTKARDVESAIRNALATGEVGILDRTNTPTLVNFGPRFEQHLKAHVATRTARFYKDSFASLTKFAPMATTRLHLIDTNLIERFKQARLKDVMPGTVNNDLRTLRRALHLAAEWKMITRSPKITLLPGERQREFVISEPLLKKFIVQCSPSMARLLPFLIDTGLRISEACALTWDTVSLEPKEGAERGWVYVIKGKSKYAKRHIPLTARAHAVLAECRKVSKGPFVFTAFDGRRRMSRHWPAEQFAAMRDKLKLPWDCVLHSTRHTFCTRLGESGCDAFTIQRLAGHSSIVISQRYVHPTPERLESAIEQLEVSTKSSTSTEAKNVSV